MAEVAEVAAVDTAVVEVDTAVVVVVDTEVVDVKEDTTVVVVVMVTVDMVVDVTVVTVTVVLGTLGPVVLKMEAGGTRITCWGLWVGVGFIITLQWLSLDVLVSCSDLMCSVLLWFSFFDLWIL